MNSTKEMGPPANLTTPTWWESSSTNTTESTDFVDEADDAIWILTSTFIIFTMQSGKSGCSNFLLKFSPTRKLS